VFRKICVEREEEYDRKENINLYGLEKNRIIEDKLGVTKKEETKRK